MQVLLISSQSKIVSAEVQLADNEELKDLIDWKFDWLELSQYENSRVYKIQTEKIEGLIMIQFIEDDFFEMKNIEVAPTNFGSKGYFTNVAQILIAYGCLLSFELNKGAYQGYLSFISKGELIDYYIENYNAELVYRERMYINPINGLKLIKEYLNVEL